MLESQSTAVQQRDTVAARLNKTDALICALAESIGQLEKRLDRVLEKSPAPAVDRLAEPTAPDLGLVTLQIGDNNRRLERLLTRIAGIIDATNL
jgi:hypothetical protein